MKITQTSEDILSPLKRDLKEIKRLYRICGNMKLWAEVMPTEKKIPREDGDYDWVKWTNLTPEERKAEIRLTAEYLARKKGWLKCARKLKMPGGRMLAEAFDTTYGYSPHYFGNPITPMSSPQKLQNWGWSVWRRARQILKPYGWSPSRKALEAALISHQFGQVGKIALRVAAASLPMIFGGGRASYPEFGSNRRAALPTLRHARTVLVAAKGWGNVRKRWAHDSNVIDVVAGLISHHGMTVRAAEAIAIDTMFSVPIDWDTEGYVLSKKSKCKGEITEQYCLQYDAGYGWTATALKVYKSANQLYTPYHTEGGLQAAIAAWKKQRDVIRKRVADSKKLAELLERPDGATTIVFYKTSREAGNCHAGTINWGRAHGFRNCAPLIKVVNSRRPEARRVVNLVLSTY